MGGVDYLTRGVAYCNKLSLGNAGADRTNACSVFVVRCFEAVSKVGRGGDIRTYTRISFVGLGSKLSRIQLKPSGDIVRFLFF